MEKRKGSEKCDYIIISKGKKYIERAGFKEAWKMAQ